MLKKKDKVMKRLIGKTVFATVMMFMFGSSVIANKPLKVYILVGQSNMEGHAAVSTFDHIGMDPKTAPMLKDMRNDDGTPVVCNDVYISYLTGKPKTPKIKEGKLTTGFGSLANGPKIGPEFTFGIYMQKHVKEPILLIKTAWGGKDLHTNFRPPSAGPYVWNEVELSKGVDAEDKEKKKAETGYYYRQMLGYVKKVLADPGTVCPEYNKKDGYEIAGFVWFQGFNDKVNRKVYPNRNKPGGYDLYTNLWCHFIRDVRKDLNAPKMPFVIGVMGVNGEPTEKTEAERPESSRGIAPGFRQAMAAPASMAEFKDNVIAVYTGKYWDEELSGLDKRLNNINAKMKTLDKEAINKEVKIALMNEEFTKKELKILETGRSNKAYHYLGSSKILGQIGKAFADAMAELQSRHATAN
jgi:hypothetical protein